MRFREAEAQIHGQQPVNGRGTAALLGKALALYR